MAGKKKAAGSKIKIQYYRSGIGFNVNQKLVVKGLGFKKLNAIRELEDTLRSGEWLLKFLICCMLSTHC
jgi:ribosomal protein L30/L7E